MEFRLLVLKFRQELKVLVSGNQELEFPIPVCPLFSVCYPAIPEGISENLFLEAYLAASDIAERDFLFQVDLFRARTNLGIAADLIKVGLGHNENLWRRVLLEGEKAKSCTRSI